MTLLLSAAALAQESPEPATDAPLAPDSPEPPLALDPLVVTATRLPQPLGDVPASVSIIEGLDVQGAQRSVGLEESLDRVPGVLVQSSENYAQDARIQIRGFGTRSAFGIREIRVLVDGLPETQPDGQTQIDDIDLGAIDRIEVLRGPASALYGNASGGVIQFFTEEAPGEPTAQVTLSGGSFDFGKYQVKGGGRSENVQLFVQGSYLQLGGYRAHSATRAGNVTGKLRYAIGEATDVTLLLTAVDSPQAEDPGALTRPEVCADPRQARPLNVRLDAGETVQQVRVGSVLNHRAAWSDLSAYVYVLHRDFDNHLAIPPALGDGIVTFDRISPGGGVRWSATRPLFGWQQSFTAGLDVQYQDDDRQRFLNEDGGRGARTLRQREQVLGVGPYIREAIELRDDLELSGGLRWDAVRFEVDVDDPPASGDSGARTFDQVSPGGGLRWSPRWWGGAAAGAPQPSFFGNVGTAFQTPTTTELANPDGPGFNPDVEPQTSVTYELGGRVQWRERVQGGLSLYSIHIHDELVPFESLSGRTAYRNAGRSRRNGLELDWQATPIAALAPLRWSGALTLLDAEYREYTTPAGDFAGNQEPGIPPWQVYQELLYQHPIGAFAALEAFIVDGYFVNDANSARSGGYALLNLRAGYEHTWGRWTFAPFLGLNNLTNQHYDGTVRLNALGDRYYEPAPGFNVYGGLAVAAHL